MRCSEDSELFHYRHHLSAPEELSHDEWIKGRIDSWRSHTAEGHLPLLVFRGHLDPPPSRNKASCRLNVILSDNDGRPIEDAVIEPNLPRQSGDPIAFALYLVTFQATVDDDDIGTSSPGCNP